VGVSGEGVEFNMEILKQIDEEVFGLKVVVKYP
jgi:hypothetical protein